MNNSDTFSNRLGTFAIVDGLLNRVVGLEGDLVPATYGPDRDRYERIVRAEADAARHALIRRHGIAGAARRRG